MNGNIMVTGNILKPSDYRLKDNFLPVNPAVQLNVINNIRMYHILRNMVALLWHFVCLCLYFDVIDMIMTLTLAMPKSGKEEVCYYQH